MTIERLIELDCAGFIPGAYESEEDFCRRVDASLQAQNDFEERLRQEGKVKVFDVAEVSADCRIDQRLINEAAAITEAHYGFRLTYIPGFYLTSAVGFLWGGCLLSDNSGNFAVFLLRNAFRNRERFLSYRREELLAHELCHCARQYLNEQTLEEYFAYRSGRSKLRSYLGNWFIYDHDAWGFVLPTLLLPATVLLREFLLPGLQLWPFWVLAAIYPAYLFFRNHCSRKLVNAARAKLVAAGIPYVEPVLFRMTLAEIRHTGASAPADLLPWMRQLAGDSPRWQVMLRRFVTPSFKGEPDENNREN